MPGDELSEGQGDEIYVGVAVSGFSGHGLQGCLCSMSACFEVATMLSYRHAFHAGNFADMHKHLVLGNTLAHMLHKDAPLFYLDTHAGAGLYQLESPQARKTGEARTGIQKLDFPALFAGANPQGLTALTQYHQLVTPFLEQGQYPGSPLLAASMLRRQDHLHLCELHPSDFSTLGNQFAGDRRVRLEQADGYLAINALLPPVQKRVLVLIDPSYELKSDYLQVVRALVDIYRRMPGAVVLLWYPVVERETVDRMLAALSSSALRDLWQYELGLEPDSPGHGMSASGMLALTPPWTLAEQLRNALPLLQRQLAPERGFTAVRQLLPE